MSMNDLYKVFDQTVREITREVNRSILKVPEIEQKTLDATSNEPWGPHGQAMNEIARATRNFHEYQMIMAILWKRLQDTGANWRHVYKTLVLMDFLVANGSERVVDELRENGYQIQACVEFQFVEPNGKDQGINVRKKAQTLLALLKDREKIREAREKAAANRNKYGGLSSTAYRSGGGGGYGGSSSGGRDMDSYSSRGDRDEYRSREGGANRRSSGYDDESYGRRDRDREGGDRHGRDRERYGDEGRRGSSGGRGWEGDNDGYKKEGYSHAGGTALQDDDDFEPRGKSTGGGASLPADDDFDDFDPRSAAKATAPAAAAPSAKPVAVSAPAPAVDLLDLLGPEPAAPAPAAPAAAVPHPAAMDPFAALTSSAHPPAASASVDLFGAPVSAPAAAGFSAFAAAPAPAASTSDDFEDDDFGGFAAAPSTGTATSSAAGTGFSSFSSAPKDPFGDPFSSLTPSKPTSGAMGAQSTIGKPVGSAGGGKASLWDDAFTKGIVDLKISSGNEELASIGIMSDTFGSAGSNSLNPASNVPFGQQAGGMGRAMGTGSGKGKAGASVLGSPTLMPMGASPSGAMPAPLGGMGGFPAGMGMQQPGAMAFGGQAGAMPMGAFPAFGAAPGGSNMFPATQQQKQQHAAFQF